MFTEHLHLLYWDLSYIYYEAKKHKLLKIENIAIKFLLVTVFFQMVLGVITLLMGVPIWLGVIHQIGAFILLGSTVFSIFVFKKFN